MSEVKKLQLLESEPNLVFYDEIRSLKGKIDKYSEAIQAILSEINSKEVYSYQTELNALQSALSELTESVINKDTIVNIPLDDLKKDLGDKLIKLEQSVKAIKFPEFPEIDFSVIEIPEFPIESLQLMVNSLKDELVKNLKELKTEEKPDRTEEVITYLEDFFDERFRDLIKAVKNVSISVSGGGGGIGERANVNLDNISSNQTNGTQKTQIVDSDGDIAEVVTVNGGKGLVTISPGHISEGNSTSTPLGAGETFTGVAEDITNFGVIVVSVESDVVSATNGFCMQFSTDNVNWYDAECYTIPVNNSKTYTYQCEAQYFRAKYTNGSSAQSEFRLQIILKPYYVKPSSHKITDNIVGEDDAELVKAVLTGINKDGVFTNVETSYANGLQSSLIDGETGRRGEIEPLGALKVEMPIRLVGTTFANGTKDPNFWTETVTGSGSVSQSGEIILATGTTADSTVKYTTVDKARKITGTTNQFRAVARNITAPQADNVRRIGAYDDDNGFFLQFNGITFGVGSRKDGVDTIIENGSFNGNRGDTIDFGSGLDFTRIIIDYTALSARFFINGHLIHTISASTTSLTNTLNLPATIENFNENGNTTDNSYEVLFATILRLGEISTGSKSYFQQGTTAGVVLKYNAGIVSEIVVSGVANNSVITLYDNTSATGTVLWSSGQMPANAIPFDINLKAVPFNNGLTLTITGANSNALVIYE